MSNSAPLLTLVSSTHQQLRKKADFTTTELVREEIEDWMAASSYELRIAREGGFHERSKKLEVERRTLIRVLFMIDSAETA